MVLVLRILDSWVCTCDGKLIVNPLALNCILSIKKNIAFPETDRFFCCTIFEHLEVRHFVGVAQTQTDANKYASYELTPSVWISGNKIILFAQ